MKIALIIVVVLLVVGAIVYFAVRDHRIVAASGTTAAVADEPTGNHASPQKAFLEENAKKLGWKATESGLQYFVIEAVDASAPHPAPSSAVTVHYEGRLIDGTVFDSSYARGEPISFPLRGVIQGWQEGVPMMRVGDTWEFAIPSDLGYGDNDSGPIPGGSTLIFKVQLLNAKTTVP